MFFNKNMLKFLGISDTFLTYRKVIYQKIIFFQKTDTTVCISLISYKFLELEKKIYMFDINTSYNICIQNVMFLYTKIKVLYFIIDIIFLHIFRYEGW